MRKMHTILVFAQNRKGVLERITTMIRKKMYNLEQITASDTEKLDIKRITISFSHEEGAKLPQIIAQMKKIVEVVKVKLVEPEQSLQREAGLIKLARNEKLSEILSLAQIFNAQVVHTGQDSVILQLVGAPQKLDDFLSLASNFTVLEYGRSGAVAMEKGF
jgi:acetolactate synthase-1/3 small subunit